MCPRKLAGRLATSRCIMRGGSIVIRYTAAVLPTAIRLGKKTLSLRKKRRSNADVATLRKKPWFTPGGKAKKYSVKLPWR